jgi:sugar fermentation stimulation protein A
MADPGRLRELLLPEKRLWLRPASKPERKTRWTAVLVESPDGSGLISLDSTLPNRLIAEALRERAISELSEWEFVRAEVKMGRSRFDFLLSRGESDRMVLEVKSVTLVEDGIALFPDAVTERGARHVRELAEIAARPGWEAAVLFVLQRPDAGEIRAARSIDPKFSDALAEAAEAGVKVLGRRCRVLEDRVELGSAVPAGVG